MLDQNCVNVVSGKIVTDYDLEGHDEDTAILTQASFGDGTVLNEAELVELEGVLRSTGEWEDRVLDNAIRAAEDWAESVASDY